MAHRRTGSVVWDADSCFAAFALQASATGAATAIAATGFAAAVGNAVGDAVEDSGIRHEAADFARFGAVYGNNLTGNALIEYVTVTLANGGNVPAAIRSCDTGAVVTGIVLGAAPASTTAAIGSAVTAVAIGDAVG